MFIAPTPQLTGCLTRYAAGIPGVRQTIAAMRALVNKYKVDLGIRQAATSTIFLTPERDELAEVRALFLLVRDSVRYVRDIHNVETLMSPDKTLASRLGDCDDQVTLLATLCEAVGYPTRFVVAAYSMPSEYEHVYMQVQAGQWIDADPTEPHALGWAPPDPVSLMVERV